MQTNAKHEVDLSGTLPSDVTLTSNEKLELAKLEKLYSDAMELAALKQENLNVKIVTSQFKIYETTNVGIHYFCIRNDVELFALAGNNHISVPVAYLIFEKIKDKDFKPFQVAYYSLLTNSLVCKDYDVFKLIFEKVYSIDSKEATQLLFSFRNLAFSLPISIIMLLLTSVREINSSNLTQFYSDVIELRKYEIKVWLAENFPELAELPLNWILYSRVLRSSPEK